MSSLIHCYCLGTALILAGYFTLPIYAEKDIVKVEKTTYGGWENCYRISNGKIELIAVADIGPRIIHFGLVGEENQFFVVQNDLGVKGGSHFHLFGGQRLWIAPEGPKTSYPDNFACSVQSDADSVTLTAPPEVMDYAVREKITSAQESLARMDQPDFKSRLGVQKEMTIRMEPDGLVTVVHKAANRGVSAMKMAPWALTVLVPGGFAVLPNMPITGHDGDHLLPVRNIITWGYTRLTDPRITLGDRYIIVRQDAKAELATKIGVSNPLGWAAYARQEYLFVKFTDFHKQAQYPDLGSSMEIYSDRSILEFETLGPWSNLSPGEAAVHEESWRLFKPGVIEPTDAGIDQIVLPLLKH